MRRERILGAAAALVCAAAAHAQAPPGKHALDFTIAPSVTYDSNTSGNAMYGWLFQVNQPVHVTALDVWVEPTNLFLDAGHEVGIWNANGNLMVSATVTNASPFHNGVPASLGLSGWRYEPVAPTLLVPGLYTIGAHYGNAGDTVIYGASPTTVSQITYLEPAYAQGAGLLFSKPAPLPIVSDGYFGPSFHIASTSPEPGTFVLVGIGICATATSRRSIRRWRKARDQP